MMQTTSETKKLLTEFVDKLVAEKNFNTADEEVLAEIKADLLDRAEIHLNAGLLEALPSTAMPEFERLLDEGNNDHIKKFLQQHIPNMEVVIAKILLDFKSAYLLR